MPYWNKRGIAPLVATLLLISFAVALGIVVMNFGRAQVELEAECAVDIGLRFAEIGGQQQFCYDTSKKALTFTLENGVNIKVEGLIVNVIDTEKAQTFELNDAKMIKAGSYVGRVAYDLPAGGSFRQIKITPKVVLNDGEQICIEKALVIEAMKNC